MAILVLVCAFKPICRFPYSGIIHYKYIQEHTVHHLNNSRDNSALYLYLQDCFIGYDAMKI